MDEHVATHVIEGYRLQLHSNNLGLKQLTLLLLKFSLLGHWSIKPFETLKIQLVWIAMHFSCSRDLIVTSLAIYNGTVV